MMDAGAGQTIEVGIHRADVVGSMLRPPWLIEAREELRAGTLARDAYTEIEDRAVDEAISIQQQAGVDVVTDGEMRRDIFFDLFVNGMSGFSRAVAYTVRFRGKRPADAMEVQVPFAVTDEVRLRSSPALDEFLAARDRTEKPLKVTLPSPMLVGGFWSPDHSRAAYPDPFALFAEAAEVVHRWAGELFDAGCRYVQIDAPEFNEVYADARVRADYESRGIDPARFKAEGAQLLNHVAGVSRPPGALLGLHVCKGNGTQSWIAEGGYEEICREVFKEADGFDVFHLEFDDERSGSFEPLRHLPEDKVAVLGLVSTKWQALEEPELLRRRVDEAAAFHPLERLALATQCGFASASETAEQRKITPKTQAAKLRLVADVAHSIWG
jgi:5-methyltetrahydropteroyltriglutamate--homocysteine methyltransferase